MISRLNQLLTFFAALAWVSHPIICDLRHMAEEMEAVVVHTHVSDHSDHHHEHHSHDHEGDHSPDDDDDDGDSFQIEKGHQCCGGHDRAPVVTMAKCDSDATDAGKLVSFPVLASSLQIAYSPGILAQSLVDMPIFLISQGNPCAHFCRWLI